MRVGGEVTPDTLAQFDIAVYELTESCIHIMDKDKSSHRGHVCRPAQSRPHLRCPSAGRGAGRRLPAGAGRLHRATLPERDGRSRVFVYDSGEDKPFTAGRYAMPTALIEAAGGTNIMDDVRIELGRDRLGAGHRAQSRGRSSSSIMAKSPPSRRSRLHDEPTRPSRTSTAVINDRFVVLEYVEATPGPRNIAAVQALAAAFADLLTGHGRTTISPPSSAPASTHGPHRSHRRRAGALLLVVTHGRRASPSGAVAIPRRRLWRMIVANRWCRAGFAPGLVGGREKHRLGGARCRAPSWAPLSGPAWRWWARHCSR